MSGQCPHRNMQRTGASHDGAADPEWNAKSRTDCSTCRQYSVKYIFKINQLYLCSFLISQKEIFYTLKKNNAALCEM